MLAFPNRPISLGWYVWIFTKESKIFSRGKKEKEKKERIFWPALVPPVMSHPQQLWIKTKSVNQTPVFYKWLGWQAKGESLHLPLSVPRVPQPSSGMDSSFIRRFYLIGRTDPICLHSQNKLLHLMSWVITQPSCYLLMGNRGSILYSSVDPASLTSFPRKGILTGGVWELLPWLLPSLFASPDKLAVLLRKCFYPEASKWHQLSASS